MRPSIPAALALSLLAACYGNTSGTISAPCSGANCVPVGNGGALDAGDAGLDGGDGGRDGGDAGPGDAGSCASFTGVARDFCRTGQDQTLYLSATGCSGTLFFDTAALCAGSLDRGDAFDGGCDEPVGHLQCSAAALPGIISCQTGPGSSCSIVVCGPGHFFEADGGCSP